MHGRIGSRRLAKFIQVILRDLDSFMCFSNSHSVRQDEDQEMAFDAELVRRIMGDSVGRSSSTERASR